MRSRRCCVPGRPAGDTEASGRRVTRKAPSAHVEGGSGRSEASPTTILQDTHSVEGDSVLKNSPYARFDPRSGPKHTVFGAFWSFWSPISSHFQLSADFFNRLGNSTKFG